MSEIAIGIDLGTSNSVVAVVENGQPKVIPNRWGETVHPSIVNFGENDDVLVGSRAKKKLLLDPENTVYSFKRLMGRYFFSEEVKKARELLPYDLVEGPNREVRVQVRDHAYPLPEISAYMLTEMRRVAEAYLGMPVSKAVVTVPAHFNDNQRQATKDACRIAGLDVLKIINEPTAVALAYGYDKQMRNRVAVYDLGGGTFDVTVLDINLDVFEVRSTAGDTFLGGDDFDARIMDYLIGAFYEQVGIDLRRDRQAMQKLKEHSEWAKIQLSEVDRVEVSIPDIARDDEGSLTLSAVLTVKQLAQMTYDLVQRTFGVCDEAIQAAGCNVTDIDGVVLVGGQSKSRFIRSAVEAYFSKRVQAHVNPDEAVALGAAIHADQLVNRKTEAVLIDVTPLSLRVGTVGGYTEVVIPKNTPIPIEHSKTFVTASDNQERVRIRIYQGESKAHEHNELLGEFEFSGFRIAPRGEVEVVVTFDIDADGIVNVRAVEKESGVEAQTQITISQHLTEAEIHQIRQAQ
ncbi:MAG: Hsp70 family protein [Myxococcales bacterium]|nr:Hsp70 family protein [Myxococcales bacterium]MCB9538821.1 Hsp70 family protein [Myxococcales bacterium]